MLLLLDENCEFVAIGFSFMASIADENKEWRLGAGGFEEIVSSRVSGRTKSILYTLKRKNKDLISKN